MKNMKISSNCHTLRYAAGQYWLLDLDQPGIPYKKPMCLNEVGAKIWEFFEKEKSVDFICKQLAMEYEIDENVICEDVLQFLEQLKVYGVKIEE